VSRAGDRKVPIDDVGGETVSALNEVAVGALFAGGEYEVRETHISKVILTSRYVYKFKKPVRFDFLDYSTLAKRVAACREEIRLNQRLTEGVYLGLALVIWDQGGLCWAPQHLLPCGEMTIPSDIGKVIDVGVVMRRLPAAMHLDKLIETDYAMATRFIAPLVRKLANFHREHNTRLSGAESIWQVTVKLSEENFSALASMQDAMPESSRLALEISRQHSERFLNQNRKLMLERAWGRYLVDGHGDLRPEHICFEGESADPHIQIYDCVEFNRSLRVADCASEVAFLAMELDAAGYATLADYFINSYIKAAGDTELLKLDRFFRMYRSLVRAKVAFLTAAQLQDECARSRKQLGGLAHIALASRYALDIRGPQLIAIGGLMGVGKSMMARNLANFLHARILSSDQIRGELFPAKSEATYSFAEGVYSPAASRATYEEMIARAGSELERGNPVIVDASFMRISDRSRLAAVGRQYGVRPIFIECILERAETMRRLEKRLREKSDSDGRPELYGKQFALWEAMRPEENMQHLRVSTEEDPAREARKVLARIQW
jgi:aminoglycoside phosphotransferase family enzyme/predicted kinase